MEDIGQLEIEEATPRFGLERHPQAEQSPEPLLEYIETAEWEKIASGSLSSAPMERKLAIISRDVRNFTSVAEGARSLGANIYQSNLLREALSDVMSDQSYWVGVILVYTDFGPIGINFDLIRSFRQRVPSVPVILMSPELFKDDLTKERLPLCDISLRLPIDLSYLAVLMDAAEINNAAWTARCLDLNTL